MPKGTKLRTPDPPAWAHCDFCPAAFSPQRWNCRTCPACEAAGKPCQCEPGYTFRLGQLGLTGRDPAKRQRGLAARGRLLSRRETNGGLCPVASVLTPTRAANASGITTART